MESLLEGRWALPDQGPEWPAAGAGASLTAAEAASALRCLAAAPHLPPLSYSALCRKLLRAYGGSAPCGAAAAAGVWQACIALAAVHGARTPAYQLADFIASDLLPPARLEAMPGAARTVVLRLLAPLLAALPEAQAAAALEAACGVCCPDLGSGKSMVGGCELATALLDGLRAVLGDPGSNPAASAVGPAVRQAAQRCLDSVVLPRLPPPEVLPVCLAALAEASKSGGGEELGGLQRLLAPEQRCWAAALRCLACLPQVQALQLVLQRQQQRPLQLASAAALLVAAGAADARALQAARNLALEGGGNAVAAASGEAAEAAALLVGRAAASLPLSQQQQWLSDMLDASLRCSSPAGAVRMAACIGAACAAGALLSGERAVPQLAAGHVWLASTEAAVAALPEALGSLLEAASWRKQRGAVLHCVTAALQQLGGGGLHPWAAPLLLRCLLAARHVMPEQHWAALAGVI